jgi:hypothetical protein
MSRGGAVGVAGFPDPIPTLSLPLKGRGPREDGSVECYNPIL